MASLYKIQEELINLFVEIENNDGEVTDEQLELLNVKEEELSKKLDDYHKAIQSWKADIDSCKLEEKRINSVRKKYENRISRLKNHMLDAVNMFGENGKTNKFIELPTVRIYTKNSKSVEIDETRINILISTMRQYIIELYKNDVLYVGNDVDFAGILQAINAIVIAEQGETFKPFTLDDLALLEVDITYTDTFVHAFLKHKSVLELIGNDYINVTIKNNTLKDSIKQRIEIVGQDVITIGKIVENQSLQMK